jgi:CDP-diacylglycerol--glycerol-3-phosphate 3-phosphatidyltransferase
MLEKYRSGFASFLRPLVRLLARLHIHPNVVTVAGTLVFAGAGYAAALGYWWWSVPVGLIGAGLDGVDGVLAREHGKKTVFGGILDSVCDRFTEIFWLSGILAYYLRTTPGDWVPVALALVVITGSLAISYIKARAEAAGVECTGGIMQRPERLIILAVLLLTNPTVMLWGLGILGALSYFTVFERIAISYRNAKKMAETSTEPSGEQPIAHETR